MVKLMTKQLKVYDPHDMVLSAFEGGDVKFLTSGKVSDFKFKIVVVVLVLFILRAVSMNYVPQISNLILIAGLGYILVWFFWNFFTATNSMVKKSALVGLGKSCGLLSVLIMIAAVL